MNKTSKFLLVLLFFVIGNNSYGKSTVVPGYIITLTNDTVVGYIDFKEWKLNPKKVLFKNTETDKGRFYYPPGISEFGASDEIYKSATVDIDLSPHKTSQLRLTTEVELVIDTVFLRALITGEKGLYYLLDVRGKESFYISQNNKYVRLVHNRYLVEENGSKYPVSNNKYIGQLMLYLKNCKSINQVLSKSTYTLKSLVKSFNYYYECTNTTFDYQKEKPKVKVDLGTFAGVSFTNLKYTGEGYDELTNADFPLSTNIAAGIAGNLFLPRNLGRWSINNELMVASFSYSNTYQDFIHENRYINYETEIAYTYLKLNNMLRYNLPVGGTTIFFDLGFSNGLAISNINKKKKTSVFYDKETVEYFKAIERSRNHEQSLLFDIGCSYNRFSATIRYEVGNGMSMYSDLVSTTKRYYIFLAYRFF